MTRQGDGEVASDGAQGRVNSLVAALRSAGGEPTRRPAVRRSTSLDVLLPQGHQARLIWDYVIGGAGRDAGGMVHFEGEVSGSLPEVLLALWLYASSKGIGSAQEIAELCRSHAGFRWLASGSQVDAQRLTEFRMQAPMAVDELLTETLAGLQLAGVLGAMGKWTAAKGAATDGAAASRGTEDNDAELLACLDAARRTVRALRAKLDDPVSESVLRRKPAAERRVTERKARATLALEAMHRLADAQTALQRRQDMARRKAEEAQARPPLVIKLRPVLGVEPILPWNVVDEESQRFRRALGSALAAVVLLVTLLIFVKPPPMDRTEADKISPRLAKLVLEQKTPLKVERVKIDESLPKTHIEDSRANPEAKADAAATPQQQRETSGAKPSGQQVADARARASRTGLVAMRDQLVALRALSASSANSLRQDQFSVGTEGTAQRGERDLVGGAATAGSGGVAGGSIAYGGGGSLVGHRTTQVKGGGGSSLAEINKAAKSGKRSPEDIKQGFDANKSALYAIYRRALRENPQLEGRVVLKLSIDASGQVTSCVVTSSALKDAALEDKLVARVSLINFGARPGIDSWTGSYHIDFVPTS